MTLESPKNTAIYTPGIFDVATMDAAKAIILTAEEGTNTQERWEKETPFLTEDIGQRLGIGPDSCVMDYGCGIGRMSKALIDRYGCRAIGVDFSKSMQLLAPEYVLSERFTVWSPQTLQKMVAKGFRADAAICIWVIQHVHDAAEVIGQISNAIKAGGLFYALNQNERCVPTNVGWVTDGFDIQQGLRNVFKEEHAYHLPTTATTEHVAASSTINVLRKARG